MNLNHPDTPPNYPGFFITLEGIDGAGKSTQGELLGKWLRASGYEVVVTREPGGTSLGQRLRKLVLHGEELDARTEALIFAADRAHHVHTIVMPALLRGAVVISDRYIDSSLAYQGAARRLGVNDISQISTWATAGLWPDLTILLDLNPATGASRRQAEADRLESESADFHHRVRQNFLNLAHQRQTTSPATQLILNATASPAELHHEITTHLAGHLPPLPLDPPPSKPE